MFKACNILELGDNRFLLWPPFIDGGCNLNSLIMMLSTFSLDCHTTVLTRVENRMIDSYFVAFVNFGGCGLSDSRMRLILFIDSEVS